MERLWKQEQRNKSNIETMDDESLCKICMDSPVSWWVRFSSGSPNILCSDWLCYAGVWAHVYLYAVWQADGRVSYMQAVCCKVSVSNTYRVIQWNWNKFWVYYSDQEATYGIKETKTVMQFSNSARDVYTISWSIFFPNRARPGLIFSPCPLFFTRILTLSMVLNWFTEHYKH